MRDSLTSRELKAIEKVPDKENKEFLSNIWLSEKKPRFLLSGKEFAFWAFSVPMIYGILILDGGLRNLALVAAVALAITSISFAGLGAMIFAALASELDLVNGEDSSQEAVKKLYVDSGRKLLVIGKVRYYSGFAVDVAVWAALIVSGSVFLGVVVMILDLMTRLFFFLIRNNLRTSLLTRVRAVVEREEA